MGKYFGTLMVSTLVGAAAMLLFGSPASAISVELAKKCRELAINAHPPPLTPGGKPYAQAEREFFANCVAKNGQVSGNGTQDNAPAQTPPKQK